MCVNMIDLFELLGNEKFFSVLNGVYKTLYWEILDSFYEEIEQIPERRLSRMRTRNIIEEIIVQYNIKNNASVALEPHEFIKTFFDCGWWLSSYDGTEGVDFIYMTQFANNLIKFFHDEQEKNIQTDNYIGVAISIAEEIMTCSMNYPYRDGLCRIDECLKSAIHSLVNVQQQTKRAVADILSIQHIQEVVDRLSGFAEDLSTGYLHHVYKHLYIKENQKSKMLEMLRMVSNHQTLRRQMVDDLKNKYLVNGEHRSDDKLESELDLLVRNINQTLRIVYPRYEKKLNHTKNEVIEKAMMKIDMITAGNSSYITIAQKIIENINALEEKNVNMNEMFDSLFNVQRVVVFDDKSLYEKKEIAKYEEIEPVECIVFEADDEYENEITKYVSSVNDANRYAKALLKDNKELSVEQLCVDDDLLEQLETICCFSEDIAAEYEIILTGEIITKAGCQMDSFIIRSK